MKKMNSKLKTPNPLFHLRNKLEDQSVLSTAVLRQAKKSGKLNLSNKCLSTSNQSFFIILYNCFIVLTEFLSF